MIDELASLLLGRRTVVLAGAGCSTESGIPDYRGPEGSLRTRRPVQYGEFVRSEATRRRYWARSAVGWRRVAEARPNAAHTGFAKLEEAGAVTGIITQNVDGLHQAAGSRRVIELHGSLAQVVCLGCAERTTRSEMQTRLESANEDWIAALRGEGTTPGARAESAPDGDAELDEALYADFRVPDCAGCGGVLKPDVVFFGENVPRARVATCWEMLADADVLLVAGSSLTVYSGRRFVYGAVERGMPVGVVNLGPTRADEHASARVDARLGEAIPQLVARLAR